jgi:hypothetical protein
MTASIHPLHRSTGPSIDRVREAACTLSRMPVELASAIEVVGLEAPEALLAAAASSAAAEFGVVAIVRRDPVLAVRFERA